MLIALPEPVLPAIGALSCASGLVYGSVCSGIEAATVAWEPLGWRPAFFAEIEPFPSAVLAHCHRAIPNLGDMTAIDGRAWRGRIDALVGGTPCQAFSVAGLRRSLDDERGNLALRFVELADACQPRWIVWDYEKQIDMWSRSGNIAVVAAFAPYMLHIIYGFPVVLSIARSLSGALNCPRVSIGATALVSIWSFSVGSARR